MRRSCRSCAGPCLGHGRHAQAEATSGPCAGHVSVAEGIVRITHTTCSVVVPPLTLGGRLELSFRAGGPTLFCCFVWVVAPLFCLLTGPVFPKTGPVPS